MFYHIAIDSKPNDEKELLDISFLKISFHFKNGIQLWLPLNSKGHNLSAATNFR